MRLPAVQQRPHMAERLYLRDVRRSLKDSVRTAQETLAVLVMETDQLTVYKDIISVWSQNHTKYKPLSTL
jgi:hypothetical protein